jgi:hypothetical protein
MKARRIGRKGLGRIERVGEGGRAPQRSYGEARAQGDGGLDRAAHDKVHLLGGLAGAVKPVAASEERRAEAREEEAGALGPEAAQGRQGAGAVVRADAAEEDGTEWCGEISEDRGLVVGGGGLAPGCVDLYSNNHI